MKKCLDLSISRRRDFLSCVLGGAGCTDPSAANYNPNATAEDGSCTFVVEKAGKEEELSGDLHTYVTTALSSLWGARFCPSAFRLMLACSTSTGTSRVSMRQITGASRPFETLQEAERFNVSTCRADALGLPLL